MSARKPVRFLHYRGDVTLGIPPAMGPNTLNEVLYPVAAAYDPDMGRTTVGLSYIAPEATP